jgi:beta-glucosidase
MEYVERAQLRGLTVGAEAPKSDDLIARAVAAAAAAEVAIVVVGTSAEWETEGEDRDTMDLPGDQDELIRRVAAVNPRTIVVVNAGSPVTMPWVDDVAAVMQVWFPGEEFGDALADMLLGVHEPGGRLPITIPVQLSDTPAFRHHPGRDGLAVYEEGLFIGHRWYDAQGITPQFPFGHGIGYTSWSMGEATLSGSIHAGVTVSVPVRNTGERDGATVVQCYVGPSHPSADRPVRTLGGFTRVTAAAGEAATATIELPSRAFARWDIDLHDWVVDPGPREVWVGWSSAALSAVYLTPAG